MIRFYLTDKLIAAAARRGVRPLEVALVLGLAAEDVYLITCSLYGAQYNGAVVFALAWLLFGPSLVNSAFRIYRSFARALIKVSEGEVGRCVSVGFRSFWSWYHLIPSAVLLPLLWVFIYREASGMTPFHAVEPSHWTFFVPYGLLWTLVGYMGTIGLWGVFSMVRLFWCMRTLQLRLDPLSGDKMGGLGFMADLLRDGLMRFSSGAMLLPAAFVLVRSSAGQYRWVPLLIFGALFLAAVVSGILVPYWVFHKLATRAKERQLAELRVSAASMVTYDGVDPAQYRLLRTQRDIQVALNEVRTWPLNWSAVGSMVWALAVTVVAAILERMIR